MNGENINIGTRPLRVLISPLDWGLGHATRIITIVKTLQKYDVEVLIAAEAAAASLLSAEFPGVTLLSLNGYRVRYSRSKRNFFLKLLQQLPAMSRTMREENRWLKNAVKEHSINAVISDNRFGFYHASLPSVYITHQLFIETGIKWMNTVAQKIHYRYINRFSECWVPDFPQGLTLAGKLSHPQKMPAVPVKYLGPLSRFTKKTVSAEEQLLVLLSGPEPQRSTWEKEILHNLKDEKKKIVMVRGLPGSHDIPATTSNFTIYNHLPAQELNVLILRSAFILCRSGYSTVMDLYALQKNALLVPTPGQAEQEYLAEYLNDQRLFNSSTQPGIQYDRLFIPSEDLLKNKPVEDYRVMNEKLIKDWVDRLRASQ